MASVPQDLHRVDLSAVRKVCCIARDARIGLSALGGVGDVFEVCVSTFLIFGLDFILYDRYVVAIARLGFQSANNQRDRQRILK